MSDPATIAAPGQLRFERTGPIAWIIADNPIRHNAYSQRMWADIPVHVAAAEADADVRVIVLRGAGSRAFSAGADISEFESARTGEAARHYDALNEAAFAALLGARKPLIAMIHGFCLGGGLGVAACCDLRICDEAAQFSIPAAKLGLGYAPRWVATLLRLARPASVKELIFTGRRFSAGEALRMGLVNSVSTTENLEEVVRQLASEIASNAPLTIGAAKAAIDEIAGNPGGADIAHLNALAEACMQSEDYAEGRRAFLEKRKPVFQGR